MPQNKLYLIIIRNYNFKLYFFIDCIMINVDSLTRTIRILLEWLSILSAIFKIILENQNLRISVIFKN